MKRLLIAAVAGLSLLLGGCATTVRSHVTTFSQLPANLADKTYVFAAPPAQDDTLEFRSYQNMVRGELTRLGFQDAGASGTPAITVNMRFLTTDIPVQVVQVMPPPSYYYGYYGWRRRYWGAFYDPFWYGNGYYTTHIEHQFRRELQVSMTSVKDNQRLWDVTVRNMSREESTPKIMPALVRSAFEGFPGPNGQSRVIELKLDENAK